MKTFLFSALALVTISTANAQQKITEGTASYTVEYQLPDAMKPYAAFFPKDAIVHFKGDSTMAIQKTPQRTTSVLTNTKAGFMRIIVEAAGKTYVVVISPAEMEEMELSLPEQTYTAGTETQTVAGFKATKFELKNKKDGKVNEAWFTKDVIIPVNSLTNSFDVAQGTPVIFTASQGELGIKSTLREIKAGTVPAGTFSIPKGAETLTMAQFKAMNGGK